MTRAAVDTAALGHNLRQIRRRVGDLPVLGVVKADAYGHGARLVGPALERHGIDWLAVALVEEGIELREAGVRLPLLVLDGAYGQAYDQLIAHQLTPVVFRADQLDALVAAAQRAGKPAEAHLKVDTGMSRLGVSLPDVAAFATAAKTKGVRFTGLCTHFANADLGDAAMARTQLTRFAAARAQVVEAGHAPALIHLANSAATLELNEARETLVRPGLMLYGYVPAKRFAGAIDLRPALTWTTEIVQLRRVPAGTPVSYGGKFVTDRESTLATLAVGYADGYRRSFSNKAQVLIRGERAPIVGAVTMDLSVADVTGIPSAAVGDEVVLLGAQGRERVSAEELAQHADTIHYEILCDISARVPRVLAGAT